MSSTAHDTRHSAQPFAPSAHLAQLLSLSREELEGLQLARLRRQLARLRQSSAYYGVRMERARIDPDAIGSLADFFAAFPMSTKVEFLADQNDHPPFGERLGPMLPDRIVPMESSRCVNVLLTRTKGGRSPAVAKAIRTSSRDVQERIRCFIRRRPQSTAAQFAVPR